MVFCFKNISKIVEYAGRSTYTGPIASAYEQNAADSGESHLAAAFDRLLLACWLPRDKCNYDSCSDLFRVVSSYSTSGV